MLNFIKSVHRYRCIIIRMLISYMKIYMYSSHLLFFLLFSVQESGIQTSWTFGQFHCYELSSSQVSVCMLICQHTVILKHFPLCLSLSSLPPPPPISLIHICYLHICFPVCVSVSLSLCVCVRVRTLCLLSSSYNHLQNLCWDIL